MPQARGYGTVNKQLVAGAGALGAGIGQTNMKKKSREERQPLLLAGQNEPVNDLYDRTPLHPRPDVGRVSDVAVVQLPTGAVDTPSSDGKPPQYDPLLERQNEHPTSNLDTMIHLLKGNIGTGILAMPDAFRNAGLIIGLFGTLVMGVICTHCMHMLVRCAHELCRRHKAPALSFSQVVEAAFQSGPYGLQPLAKYMRLAVNIFLCLTQLGFCCVYFVFVATNIQEFLNNYNVQLSLMTYLWILLFPMILLNLVKNLKYLTPISLLASLCTVGGLGVTFFYVLQGLPKTSSVNAFSSWSQLPLYFGTAIYAFEGIGMVLPLENNMKTPQDFGGWNGVLNTGMVIVASLYTAVGFFGYLKYGDAVKVGSITLNLPHDILAQSVKLTMALAIYLSYGLQLYVPVNIIWPPMKEKFSEPWMQRFGEDILRTVLVVFTFGLAAMIPNLSAVISLVGAVSSSTLAVIFPPIIEIVTFWNGDFGRYNWIFWKDVAIAIFGVLGFGFGSYASIYNIIAPTE